MMAFAMSPEQFRTPTDSAPRHDAFAPVPPLHDAELFGHRRVRADGSRFWTLTLRMGGARITVDGRPGQNALAVLRSLLANSTIIAADVALTEERV